MILLLWFGLSLMPIFIYGQVDTEFWVVAPEINDAHHASSPSNARKGAPGIFRFTTFDLETIVTLSLPANLAFTPLTFTIPPNTTYSYEFWRPDCSIADHDAWCAAVGNPAGCTDPANWCTDLLEIENFVEFKNISSKGVLIKTDNPITCYFEISAFYNREIMSLKGRNAKGNDFYVPFQTQWPNQTYANTQIYSAIHIVATEDLTQVTVVPTKQLFINDGTGVPHPAFTPKVVTLNKGEVFTAVPYEDMSAIPLPLDISRDPLRRLEGTRVTSNYPVVVHTTDDLINGSGGVDFVADQHVPNSILGTEYIVMKGQADANPIDGRETAYIIAVEDNTPIYIDGVGPLVTLSAGQQYAYQIKNNATYISTENKSKPITILHVSGFGAQLGGAILPPIDDEKCTGSFDVVVNRSNDMPFNLVVLVRVGAEGGFTVNGNAGIITAGMFNVVPNSTDWLYARIPYNAPVNVPLNIKNSINMFHLGTLMGISNQDCFYGYFSDFDTNRGEAVSSSTESGLDADHCLGDTIQLRSQGGVSYNWTCVTDNSFNDNTLSSPYVVPIAGLHKYDVLIERTCWVDTTMTIYVKLDSVSSDFIIDNPNCCSPTVNVLNNKSFGDLDYYYWAYSDGTFSQDSSPAPRTYINNTYIEDTVIVGLTVGKNCYDYHEDTIFIRPQILAKAVKGSREGCQQDIIQAFAVDTVAAGPFDIAHWEWGDGTGDTIVQYIDAADSVYHTFTNLNNYDTTYYITLNIIDTIGNCINSVIDSVFVPGIARARFAINNTLGCSPLEVTIQNNSYGDVDYEWWFYNGNDTISNAPDDLTDFSDRIITYTNTTNAPVEYYVALKIIKRNNDGTTCYDAWGIDTILVYPEFTTNIQTTDPLEGCQPHWVDFSQDILPGYANQFEWDFGDGTSTGLENPPPHKYINTTDLDNLFIVTLKATSQYGCSYTAPPVSVTAYAFFDAHFTLLPQAEGCSPFTVTLNNNTPANSVRNFWWELDGGVGLIDNLDPFTILYTNVGDVPSLHTITLTNDNGHCDSTFSMPITVNPAVTAQFNATPNTACNEAGILFSNTSFFTASTNPIPSVVATYLWDFGDGTTDNTESPTHAFKNTLGGTTTQPFTVTLSITVNGCTSIAQQTVNVYPAITPGFNSDKYWACAPEYITFTNQTVGALDYTWTFPNASSATTTNASYTFENTTLETVQTQTVRLTATNGICSEFIEKDYTVYPILVPAFNPSITTICAPDTVSFVNISTGAIVSNLWDFDDGTPTNGDTDVKHEFVNRTTNDLPRSVKLTITNEVGCQNSTTHIITVSPEVAADFVFTIPSPACYPANVPFENKSLNGTVFEWTMGDGTTYNNFTPPPHQYSTTNTSTSEIDTIRLTVTGYYNSTCTSFIEKTIEVFPDVVASFSITDDTGCSPWTSTFVNNSTGYGLNYIWDYKDGNYSSDGNATHTHSFRNLTDTTQVYDISLLLTDGNGCFANQNNNVTVYREVIADFTFLKDDVCTPFPVTFSYPSTGINGTEFTWDFGDGSINETHYNRNPFKHTFDNTNANTEYIETYQITLYAEDTVTTCDSTIVKLIDVYPWLLPSFDVDVTEGCNPLTVDFTNRSTGLANYNWSFDDGQSSPLTSPEHTFSHSNSENSETFTVKLTTTQETTGCAKNVDTIITVYSFLDAHFGLAKIDGKKGSKAAIVGGCHPFTVEIVDSSKTNATWAWDFGNGDTGTMQQPGNRTYENTNQTAPLLNVIYDVKLQVTNLQGCFDRDSAQLEVYPRSAPAFSVDNEGCHPHRVSFIDESVVDNSTKYYWVLGDGSSKVVSNFDYTYTNYSYTDIANYTATLNTTTSYGCEDTISQVITVYPKPLADFVPELYRSCPPFETSLVNSSEGIDITFFWDFDNGETKEIDQLTTEHPIYYNNSAIDEILQKDPSLRVVTEYGCEDTTIVPIYVFPAVSIGFTPSIKEGCSPLAVDFTNTSNRSAKIFTWTFGDGNTSGLKHPNNTYFNETVDDQTYVVNLQAESEHGCSNEISDIITVYLTPLVDFDAKDYVQEYPDDSVWFTNLTQPGPWSFNWDFGNGDYSVRDDATFLYLYGTWADNEDDNIFMVTLIAGSDFCSDTVSHAVKIIPPKPILSIEQITPGEGCVPLQVKFEINQQYSNSFAWEFGNNDSAFVAEPVYTYTEPGIYNVRLSATGDGGTNYAHSVVYVYALPEPDFKVNPDSVMLPDQEIHVYNLTLNGDTYEWDFGDGETSTEKDPNHLYTAAGYYDITLVSYSKEGCVNTLIQEGAVHVSGAGTIKFPNAFLPNEMSPSDGSYNDPDVDNNVFHPIHTTVKTYELWIFNRWGEQIFYSNNIEKGWNGKMNNNGKRLGQDVYFWKSQGTFQNGYPYDKAGDVTIIIK